MDWHTELVRLGIDVVLACIPLVTAFLLRFLHVSAEQKAAKIKNQLLFDAMMSLEGTVENVVAATQQKVVDDLKASRENGKLTPEDVQKIRTDVINTVKSLVSEETKELIEKYHNSIDDVIEILIEKAVYWIKHGR